MIITVELLLQWGGMRKRAGRGLEKGFPTVRLIGLTVIWAKTAEKPVIDAEGVEYKLWGRSSWKAEWEDNISQIWVEDQGRKERRSVANAREEEKHVFRIFEPTKNYKKEPKYVCFLNLSNGK